MPAVRATTWVSGSSMARLSAAVGTVVNSWRAGLILIKMKDAWF
jgi:hypothetical protein